MVSLSDAQLAAVRQRPHRTKMYMSVFHPNTVYEGSVNQSGIAKGARSITVSNLSGAIDNIETGMTVYVGSTQGNTDIARLRIVSGTGTTVVVSENSLNWEDGWFLTVVDFFEVWAVFPRIVLDAQNNAIFYKDYNTLYTDQNQNLAPIVNMGPHHAGFIQTGSHGVYYDGANSEVLGGSVSSYLWEFEGGIPTGSVSATPGFVQYPNAGYFTTRLTVTSNAGKTATGKRHIAIYDDPNSGGQTPVKEWGLTSMNGSREEGGYTASMWVREDAAYSTIRPGALIVLFTESSQGNASIVGGNATNRDEIFFVGYVMDRSIQTNWQENKTSFEVASISGRMQASASYSATLESKANAQTWNELKDMDVDRAVSNYLRWQTTVLDVADFNRTEDTKKVQYADFERGKVFDGVNSFLNSTLFAGLVTDRQGAMYAEVDVNFQPTGSRSVPVAQVITPADRRGDMLVEELETDRLSYLELGGIAYSGVSTGTLGAFLAGAPGDPAGYFGDVTRQQGLVISSQSQLNLLTGLAYAQANSRFPRVEIPISGDFRHIDIAPQEFVKVDLTAEENNSGLVWNEKPFLPQEISYSYDPTQQVLLMDVVAKEETAAIGGVTAGSSIEIPVDPPYDNPLDPSWNWEPSGPPVFDFPPPPSVPPVDPPPTVGRTAYLAWRGQTAGHPNGVIIRSDDYFSITGSSPVYEQVSVPTGSIVTHFHLAPADPLNTAYLVSELNLYRTTNLSDATPTWDLLIDSATMQTLLGGGASANIQRFIPNKTFTDTFYWLGQKGDGSGKGYLAYTHDNFASTQMITNDFGNVLGAEWVPQSTTRFARIYVGDINKLWRSDNGLTFSEVDTGAFWNALTMAFGGYDEIVYSRGRPADGGAWTAQSFDAGVTEIDISYPFDGDIYSLQAGGDGQIDHNVVWIESEKRYVGIMTQNTQWFFLERLQGALQWNFIGVMLGGAPEGLHVVEGNSNLIGALRQSTPPIVSIDGGVSWHDRCGNIPSLLGLATCNSILGLGQSITIQVVP